MGLNCKRLRGDRKNYKLRATYGTLFLTKKFKVIPLGNQPL